MLQTETVTAKPPAVATSAKPDVARGVKKTPLINREHVRALLLYLGKSNRYHQWTRVSEETLVTLNGVVRAWCVTHVGKFPSKGKTL